MAITIIPDEGLIQSKSLEQVLKQHGEETFSFQNLMDCFLNGNVETKKQMLKLRYFHIAERTPIGRNKNQPTRLTKNEIPEYESIMNLFKNDNNLLDETINFFYSGDNKYGMVINNGTQIRSQLPYTRIAIYSDKIELKPHPKDNLRFVLNE